MSTETFVAARQAPYIHIGLEKGGLVYSCQLCCWSPGPTSRPMDRLSNLWTAGAADSQLDWIGSYFWERGNWELSGTKAAGLPWFRLVRQPHKQGKRDIASCRGIEWERECSVSRSWKLRTFSKAGGSGGGWYCCPSLFRDVAICEKRGEQNNDGVKMLDIKWMNCPCWEEPPFLILEKVGDPQTRKKLNFMPFHFWDKIRNGGLLLVFGLGYHLECLRRSVRSDAQLSCTETRFQKCC